MGLLKVSFGWLGGVASAVTIAIVIFLVMRWLKRRRVNLINSLRASVV